MQFNSPSLDERARAYLQACLESGKLAGDGPFTDRCHAFLAAALGSPTLLTHSCTTALEMAALLCGIGPGDEVIMPSYTFVSTANAFVLRGAIPVFVDIREDTLNMDERLLPEAITERTRAIVPVHYAGVACEMDAIGALAASNGIAIIEDAAQGAFASYKGRALGTMGALGCLSFHETKNIVSGEGGAIVINDDAYLERAHILREKGTNRTAFRGGKVDKYEWLDIGSSYLPSDLLAALLLAQLEGGQDITARRLAVWQDYHDGLETLERQGLVMRPVVPDGIVHNAHIYRLLLPDEAAAKRLRISLAEAGVPTASHYVPLHSAPAGKRFGRAAGTMAVTDRIARTLVRLPVHANMTPADVERVLEAVNAALRQA